MFDTRGGTGKSYSLQIPRNEYGRGRWYGNWDHTSGGSRLEKMEEMQRSTVRQEDMPVKLKGKVYKTVIRPAMVYGAETWATTKRQEQWIEVTEMRMLRWICGVTRKDKSRNEHIRGTTRVAQASKKITERRFNWYGHVMRRDGEHILRKVLRADIPGKRKRGRPKTRWKDACQRDLKRSGLRRRTGRCGEERSSVIPATLHDGKKQRKSK